MWDIGEYLDSENCKCRKSLVDELVEECTENIEETRLVEESTAKMKINLNVVLTHCTFCYFQSFLHLRLELAFILLTLTST